MMDLNRIKQRLSNGEIVGLTIYGEARNQSLDGKVAVGCVIRNRLFATTFGQTYKDVCLAPHQFSCWFLQGGNYEELSKAVDSVMNGRIYGNNLLRECLFVGQGIIDNQFRDNVNGALFYRTAKLMEEKPVETSWKMEIGEHVFYKQV